MASLVFILGSVCVDLYRIGCVYVHSGGSFSECWNSITDQRQQQLTDRYLKRLDRGGRGCDNPIPYLNSGYILLEMLQREPTDDEVLDFVNLDVADAFEWRPVRFSLFLCCCIYLIFNFYFVSVAV